MKTAPAKLFFCALLALPTSISLCNKIDRRIRHFLSEVTQDEALLVYLQDEETLFAHLQSLGVRVPKSTTRRKSLMQNIELYLDARITQMQNEYEQMGVEIPREQLFD